MIYYKAHECSVLKKIAPTESDLELIQAYAPEPIEAEKLFVGRMSLANDQYDRSHERFPTEYLQRFADTIAGKGVMTGHDYRKEPSGMFFGGEVQDRAGRKELITRYYLLDSSELAAKVKAGIARSVSIGFNPDARFCDLDGKDYDGWLKGEEDCCDHIAGRDYDGARCTLTYGGNVEKVEAVEGSFVWLGCQYGAEAIGANAALSPRAKATYFESRDRKGIWQFPVDPQLLLNDRYGMLAQAAATKEASVKDIKETAPPPEPTLTAEQERLIALGKAFITAMQVHVKSRYGPCGQEKTGEVIAATFETATPDAIKAAVEAADEVFNERFPGKGHGVPISDQAPIESAGDRKFNPMRRARFGR